MAGGKKSAGGKKGSSPSVYKFYKVKGEKAERLRKECDRCGKGVFMSKHKNRQTCGKCGLTEFTQ